MYNHDKAVAAAYFDDMLYRCPLCLDCFTDSDLKLEKLTIEHVPPEDNGGKPLVVTCKKCNSSAGYSIDGQFSKKRQLGNEVAAVLGRQDLPDVHVILQDQVSGASLNGIINSKPDGLHLDVTKHNNPHGITQSLSQIKSLIEARESIRFKLTFRTSFSSFQADLSELRAAYLACFAVSGYSYATSVATKVLRDQFNDPKRHLIKPISVATNLNPNRKFIVYVAEYDIFVVCFDGKNWLLPGLVTSDGYEKISSSVIKGLSVDLSGIRIQWPKRLIAVVDKHQRKPHSQTNLPVNNYSLT